MEYQFKTKPFRHQLEAFNETKDIKSYALFWEQGCGKTKISIDQACYLYQEGKIDSVVVIAPNGVHENWMRDELPVHTPDAIRENIIPLLWKSSDATTKRSKEYANSVMHSNKFCWLFMSYDAVNTASGSVFLRDFMKKKTSLMILDESHYIKNPSAMRTVNLVKLAPLSKYRRILSGTPVAQGPFDLYSQLVFIENDIWKNQGIRNYTVFTKTFGLWLSRWEVLEKHGYDPGFNKLISYRNIDRLTKIIAEKSSRVTKESAGLDLPPKVYSKKYFSMEKTQRSMYETLKKEALIELENGLIIDGHTALLRLLRLQQIACGYVGSSNDEGELVLHRINEKNERIKALSEVLENITHACIIWCRFVEDINQIMDLLGDKAVRYDGQITSEEASESKRKFQAGEAQYFVSNPAKGREGLTLNIAKTVIYYSNGFNLIDRLQSEDRCHRIGQDRSVDYIDIIAEGTVDEKLIEALRNKQEVASNLVGDELRSWI